MSRSAIDMSSSMSTTFDSSCWVGMVNRASFTCVERVEPVTASGAQERGHLVGYRGKHHGRLAALEHRPITCFWPAVNSRPSALPVPPAGWRSRRTKTSRTRST